MVLNKQSCFCRLTEMIWNVELSNKVPENMGSRDERDLGIENENHDEIKLFKRNRKNWKYEF